MRDLRGLVASAAPWHGDVYKRQALGCGNDAYFVFYDEDARVVSGALHTKVLHADVPPLGEVDVTGFLKRCV